jgi:hypothetical protein
MVNLGDDESEIALEEVLMTPAVSLSKQASEKAPKIPREAEIIPPMTSSKKTRATSGKTGKRKKTKKRSRKKSSHPTAVHPPLKSNIPSYLGPVLGLPPMPKYSAMPAEDQVRWREEFRIKFGTLRRAFKDYQIEDVGDDEPLEIVHARYERYIRHIHINNDADSYKNYLILMFLIIELVASKVLGLPCGGYTMAQLRSMNKYQRLLIELGEKYYAPGGSSWPVEVRIIMLAMFNALVFIVIKWLANYMGEQLAETIINVLLGGIGGGNGYSEASITEEDQGQPVSNGFDLGNLIGAFTAMMGNGNGGNQDQTSTATHNGGDTTRPRRRRPVYED